MTVKAPLIPEKCAKWRTDFGRYMDQAWSARSESIQIGHSCEMPPVTEELLHHAAGCSACMARFRRGRSLFQASDRSIEAPPYLAQRVRTNLPQTRAVRPPAVVWWAAAAAAVLVIVFLVPWPSGVPQRGMEVVFYLEAPDARSVALVGDWNGWDAGVDLLVDHDGDGVWQTTIRLVPGNGYRYQFLVDGERWVADPKSPLRVDDGFGGFNSILQL
jgi:hypothetical protein